MTGSELHVGEVGPGLPNSSTWPKSWASAAGDLDQVDDEKQRATTAGTDFPT